MPLVCGFIPDKPDAVNHEELYDYPVTITYLLPRKVRLSAFVIMLAAGWINRDQQKIINAFCFGNPMSAILVANAWMN